LEIVLPEVGIQRLLPVTVLVANHAANTIRYLGISTMSPAEWELWEYIET